MNLMRKIVGHGSGSTGDGISADNTLGLMHLRKLFTDFRHPNSGTSQRELEDKLYNMLPLFCKVFGASPSNEMTEKFPDILQFCSHVSRLMVSEIRRRASNQSTDAASCSIVRFLEIESTEELSNGWMLLSSLNLLCTGPGSLVDCMTAASLPSTLVKCLYLFFDLPDVQNADLLESGCEFTPRERRVLLQKVFVQMLVRLCSHPSPAEELARKDDLTLLFSAITSWCPPHNVPWRKSAAEVLMTLSRHGLTPNVVQYIHSKGCVNLCIDNMQRVQELSPIELVEMFVTVFCFLKDSSEVSQMLLDDFRSCQGYVFLSDFLLRMEVDVSEEAVQALRNLVLLVGSLTTCGYIELKPSANSERSLFQMPGFSVPQPAGKGVSVRNLQAFQVLQTVFLKASSVHLLSTILDVISSIYHQDNANYFILEPQNTLSQFAERIHSKPKDIQVKFLDILDFVVFNLNFVPCKELISLSILIKTNQSIECSILCVQTLQKILRCHGSYKDIYREVGLLEVFVTCLHRYAALLKDPQSEESVEGIAPLEQEMGSLTMEVLTQLLSTNNSNGAVFRECGGARCAHNMVPYSVCRQQALGIVQQLVLSAGGDDDLGTLLGLMHTAPVTALELKTHILKALLRVLQESHRTRTVFRKVGGFVYVMSVLVSMEGCLAEPPKGTWNQADRADVVTLLKTVFNTLTVAMRYEPANARFFATEVRYASLTEAVRLLGCFAVDIDIQAVQPEEPIKSRESNPFPHLFSNIHKEIIPSCSGIPSSLVSATRMLRYLYDMALDNFDKPLAANAEREVSPNLKRISSVLESSSAPHNKELTPLALVQKRASTGSLSLALNNSAAPDPLIVHAGAVISMLHLVPALKGDGKHPQLSLELQIHTCEAIKSLVRTEHNQQVMCEAGLPHELLNHATITLSDETHPLHPPLQYVFERLAAQSLTPKDLRDFLRLGNPLCCATEDEDLFDARRESDQILTGPTYAIQEKTMDKIRSVSDAQRPKRNGGPVPLTRVKCLVSMTTPRDVRLHGASITPGFVEFNMSSEGFGCLYLPSITPQGPSNPSVVGSGMMGGSEPGVIGGIGSGERVFPPPSGFTFSSWICIDKFGSPKTDPHPVRLATLVRSIPGRDENNVCMQIYLSARDRSLFVSTKELQMPQTGTSEVDTELEQSDTTVRFWCPELTQEGQWRHLVLLFHKASLLKNSSVSLFIDGGHVNTQKLHYLSPNVGGTGSVVPNSGISVFAFIGTPPQLRRQSKLLWRQGPCHMFEDVVPQQTIQILFGLGPNYIGSFQAPASEDSLTSFIAEEKIIFGVYAHAMSLMTVAKIRKIYNKFDAKSIAKQLGMSAHENATPIRILHNAAGHLGGCARTFGAILMGYLGVRTFCPKPVAKMIMNTGGTSALLGLIAMALDVEGIYAAVKALVCVVRSNKMTMQEMDRTKGYQTLAMLFKRKRHLLNSHILHLTFSLVGTVDSGRETTIIPNKAAFEDLLCDLEVWHEAPADLQRSLYEHFYELLTESSEQKHNVRFMQEIGLADRLLRILHDNTLSRMTLQTILSTITVLLSGASHQPSLLHFGQFLVSLIPPTSVNEKALSSSEFTKKSGSSIDGDVLFDSSGNPLVYNIKLRNSCLEVIAKLLKAEPTVQGMNQHFCEELLRILGFDWLLLFMQENLHCTTVMMTMRILLLLLSNQASMQKFRDGGAGGGWLEETESVLQNRVGVLLGFNVGSGNSKSQKRELNADISHLPGFLVLQWLLPKHAEIAELYFLLLAQLLALPVKELPEKVEFDLDTVWTYIFGVRANQQQQVTMPTKNKGELCGEAATCILSMVRAMLSTAWDTEEEGSWAREYPVTLMQFLIFLYHNQSEVTPLFMTPDFICALVSTLFKYRSQSEANSEVTSPVEDFKPFPGSDSMVFVKTSEKSESTLTCHPAKKFVLDFLRMIIMDSLSMTQTTKAAGIIDLILEASPEQASGRQRREFQTCILNIIMEHLLAADILLGDEAAISIVSGGSYSHMANNVFYLCGRIVDKLWQGAYLKDPKEVFEFISKLISQAKRKASGLSLDVIYKCLNRTVLYQLSRPLLNTADQTNVLDALHRLTTHRGLVFGPGNYDQEFFGCLCYCLLQMTDDPTNISEPNVLRTTTWHIDAYENGGVDETEERMIRASLEAAANADGLQLLCTAAKRVWEELYICKKPCIEEVFKVTLGAVPENSGSSPKITTPSLDSVRPTILEAATRVWLTYVENERKCVYSNSERLQSQLHSVSGKLQKVGQGVIRLATRKPKRESSVKAVYTTSQECLSWTNNHIGIVKDLVQFHYKQHLQSQHHMQEFLMEEWQSMEYCLLRERGLWGPPVGSELDKWQLDLTEGPYRMRKKMIRNTLFYNHYPYRPPGSQTKPSKYKMASSNDSQLYYERYRSKSLVADEQTGPLIDITDGRNEGTEDDNPFLNEEADLAQGTPSLLHGLHSAKNIDADDETDLEPSMTSEGSNLDNDASQSQEQDAVSSNRTTDNQTILRLLEEGEKISHMFRCARIQGLDTIEGLLLFGKEHYYVVDGFTLLRTKEIADIDSLPADLHDPIIPRTARGPASQKKMCFKFAFDGIREVHKRRYLLQPIAVEVFSADGRNFLLSFPRKIRNKVHARFLTVATAIRDSAQESVSGQKQSAKVEPGTGLISSLMGEKSVTQRWERGEISNFEYLMCLNTLAGRSYNDLMQYPVFPWIVANYEDEELDLCDPDSFRDLSKPMGAQTPDRLKQFKKRFVDWDDPTGETPPYHYGTHYSSAMIVASYLVRMEPFTQTFLKLQGGHFDLADRMFHSVRDAWTSASKHNMADVKELIPEFFYLPEFLLNSNNFDLGTKQSGVSLGDVVLPTWAKGDPREFIRAHREALECDYVSAHLHEWIDLIFGHKQQGSLAVEAVNVFHHLFYEGNVDIYSIEDPLKKNAVIGFINNFGQIPKQLFKKAHPQKRLSLRQLDTPSAPGFIGNDKLFFHNLDNLRPSLQPIKELKGAVGQIIHSDKFALAVEQNKTLIPPLCNKYLAWGFSDLSIRIGNYDSDKANAVFENIGNGEILCASCPDAKTIVTAGTSTVVHVWEFGKGKDRRMLMLKCALYGHTEAATCLATSAAYNLIVSGSRDRTCIIWDLSGLTFVRQLRGHAAPVAAVSINDVTGDIATCAGTYLHVWSINGDEIASINTATVRNQQILCVCMSQLMEWDLRNVIMTGNSDGVVRMWSLEFVEVADEPPRKSREELTPSDTPKICKPTSGSIDVPDSGGKSTAQRLAEFKDPEYLRAQAVELGSSADSDGGLEGFERRRLQREEGSTFSSSENLISFDDLPVDSGVDALDDIGVDRQISNTSNSVASPASDFEMVNEGDVKDALKTALHPLAAKAPQRRLREGFHWQRQLVFRSKLTMHTAFERKDNKEPAAVTALAVSKDHKTVYVGDAKGRVFSWSVTDQPGRVMADHWVKDDGGDSCVACHVKFSHFERRHHCRNCGQLFCSKCSRFETEIRRLRILKPVRVCQACYNILKAQQASDALSKSTKSK